jgi:hypothetical protein
MKLAALALVLVVTTGCSFGVTRSVPDRAGHCVGSTPAIVDGLAAVMLAALAVRSYRDNHCDGEDGCHNYDPTGLYVLPAVVFGLSAGWGVTASRSCVPVAR